MTVAELMRLRRDLDLSQTEMAHGIGLSMRAYQVIEAGEGDIKTRHAMAVERLALRLAVEKRNPMLAPASVRREALDIAEMIRGDAAAKG